MTFTTLRILEKADIPKLGVCIRRGTDEQIIAMLKEQGITVVRRDLNWHSTEKSKGIYDFGAFNTLDQKLVANGIRTVILLGKGNALYTSAWNQPPNTDASRAAFAKWAGAVAAFFGPGHDYELFNEPNLSTFWPSGPNATQWAQAVNAAAAAIKARVPGARVVTGGLAAAQGLKAEDFAKAAAPLFNKLALDAIGTHPYQASDAWASNPLDTVEAMADRNKLMQAVTGMQVWGTESGIWLNKCKGTDYTAKRNRQGELTAIWCLASLLWPQPWNIYYDLVDDGTSQTDDEQNFGLYDANFKIKPSGVSFTKMAGLINAANRIVIERDGLQYRATFESTAGKQTVTWMQMQAPVIGPLIPNPPPVIEPAPIVIPPDTSKADALEQIDLAILGIDTQQAIDDAAHAKAQSMHAAVRASLIKARDRLL